MPAAAMLALVGTSITIKSIGPSDFGAMSVIATLIALLPFADLGLGAAITNSAAQSPDPGTDPHLRAVILTTMRLLSLSGLALIAIALAIAVTPGWTRLLGLSDSDLTDVGLASVLVLALFAAALPLSIGQRILLGCGKTHVAVLIGLIAAPVSLAGVSALATLRAPASLFAVPPALGLVVSSAVGLAVAGRVASLDIFRIACRVVHRRTSPGASVRATALPMFVILVGLPVALQSDRLVLSHRSTGAALASYALAGPLFASLWGIVSTAGLALWPIFAQQRMTATTVNKGPRTLWVRMILLFALTGAVLATLFVLTGPALLRVIGGSHIEIPTSLLAWFGVLLIVQSIHLPSGMFMTDAAGLRFQAASVMTMLLINIGVSWWATPKIGAIGPLVGSVFAVSVAQLVPGAIRVLNATGEGKGSGIGPARTELGLVPR